MKGRKKKEREPTNKKIQIKEKKWEKYFGLFSYKLLDSLSHQMQCSKAIKRPFSCSVCWALGTRRVHTFDMN